MIARVREGCKARRRITGFELLRVERDTPSSTIEKVVEPDADVEPAGTRACVSEGKIVITVETEAAVVGTNRAREQPFGAPCLQFDPGLLGHPNG